FLPMFEVQLGSNVARVEQERMIDRLILGFRDEPVPCNCIDRGLLDRLIVKLRSELSLRCAPELSDRVFQICIMTGGSYHHCVAQNDPGAGRAEKDENDCCHSQKHRFLLRKTYRRLSNLRMTRLRNRSIVTSLDPHAPNFASFLGNSPLY